jgi:hypothetical protein
MNPQDAWPRSPRDDGATSIAQSGPVKRTGRFSPISWLLAPLVIYATWIGMLALHEMGHAINAWVSGGRVIRVSIPPWGFSQTIVWPNPHELFEVWGGPTWGAGLGLIACGIAFLARRRLPETLKFFTGFCLIANGCYLGLGWIWRSGDAGDLVRLGVPIWTLIVFGIVAVGAGLMLWHRCRWLTIGRDAESDA